MQEKPLLLQSAKTAVLVVEPQSRYARYVRLFAVSVGLLCVLVGAADVTSRFAQATLGGDALKLAFAPAVTLGTATLPGTAPTSTPGVVVPARLTIPSLGVNAPVENVGLKADGTMGTPQNFNDVSWYSLGAKPGEAGSSVFAGHVNNALSRAGVFENLSKIQKGDYVVVSDSGGHSKVFRVQSVSEYEKDASTDTIFATSGPQQLVLITCDGDWVPGQKTFDMRLVVIATPL